MSFALPVSFYQRKDVVQIARDLLGKLLLTQMNNQITGGIIIETEAYKGAEDRACHAYNYRKTKRNLAMYQNGGITYVYLCYGIHYLLNVVTHTEGTPHAVLIRAIFPTFGIETMLKRRKKTSLNSKLTNGPGSVCQALGVDLAHNAISLNSSCIWIANSDLSIDQTQIYQGPRIGVDYAGQDALLPWRFKLEKLYC
ncbi:DNA-3-methyladenine glycosylase [Candidatus Rhabdochlamydia porcellionis]|jgi:DNA-3-methyladenine glycosylase|uniref:Putative 3-methyladenine DNA glycosylase n=1 Tax=Candidatus Rhabdochlamydia porcellionis TaxID=225148 RepID=A0ABX8YZE6_9BACT|nr:DNA-3-methyladenine glycosylase [Candidatus Rhabdochlamydia porcellionis]QZA58739.1 Putative 3-methyladenine DNA glycosylase [Candidatus Rhabdochlamydia porcellionis]